MIYENTKSGVHTDDDILDWTELIGKEFNLLFEMEVPTEMEEFYREMMGKLVLAAEATGKILAYGSARLQGKTDESKAHYGSFIFKLAELRRVWGLTAKEGQMYVLMQYYREHSEWALRRLNVVNKDYNYNFWKVWNMNDLIVADELGNISFDKEGSELFFTFLSL